MALSIETELPELRALGASTEVFDVPPLDISPDSLTEIARTLGLSGSGETVSDNDGWLTYAEEPHLLDINARTGGLIYRNVERHGIQSKIPFELSDDEAIDVATRFLENTNIVPRDEASVAKVTHLRGATGEVKSGKVSETVLDAGVAFTRTVADMPVTGPGGILMVHVDPQGDVVGARRVWRPIGDVVGTVTLQPVATVVTALEEIAGGVMGDTVVTKAELGYFEQGISDAQTVLEPVYAFIYLVKHEEVVLKSAAVMHAGDKPYGELEVPKRFPLEPQPARG